VRRTITLTLVAVAIASVLGPLTPASASGRAKAIRVYEGTTSDGGTIVLFTSVRDGTVRFQGVGLTTDAACADGTSLPVENGLDLSPRGLVMDGRTVDVERIFFSDAFFLSGSLGPRSGTGTIRYVVADLDMSDGPQLCMTGDLSWTVSRSADATTVRPVDAGAVLVREVPGGTWSAALVPGEGPPATTAASRAPRLRNYEGAMSSGDPMFVVTERRPGGVVLNELGLAWELDCDDGSSIGLGFFIFFAGEPLEPGRLDHDISAPMLGLHLHGTLDGHLGGGTTSTIVPALTADLDAQGCRTGDLTWRAWRIDAGY
jgi:hypothetical protein